MDKLVYNVLRITWIEILPVANIVCQVHFAHSILWLPAYAPAERDDRDEEDSAAPRTGPRSQITAVEGMKTLRQATKLQQGGAGPGVRLAAESQAGQTMRAAGRPPS